MQTMTVGFRPDGTRVRVLLVDADQDVGVALRHSLESEGFSVDLATNGRDGLSMATTEAYDVVVLDVVVADTDGMRVCEQLRASGNWTPILVLTGEDRELAQAKALDTGADDYLTKPVSLVVLYARIRALLRRAGRAQRANYQAGDLFLDPAAHRCVRGDVEVTLTAREFAVLELLMRRAGEVVSKSEILDDVWDFAFQGDPNIVEVYIRHLRKKLDEPFGRHLIWTVRGAGYRLAPDGG
jgi:two-component system, OmpR family, response regulator